MTLPSFLIIGAARSGTTTLHESLARHPQVFMSRVKEPNYFALAGEELPRGPGSAWLRATSVTTIEAYRALFEDAGGALAVGESSPRYLIHAEAAVRIHALIPEVKLVAILRHPVERAFASWVGLRRDGFDPAPTFEAALLDQDRRSREGWPFASIVDYGFYRRHLEPYLRLFRREQLRVYLFDDLLADPAGLSRDLLAFVGADPGVRLEFARRGQTGRLRHPLLGWLWRHSDRPRRLLRPLLPLPLRDLAYAWVVRGQTRPVLAPQTRARLLALYRDDTLRLQDLLRRDLGAWLV